MEEIFYPKNYLGTVAIRINPGGRKSKRKVAAQHEYALFFTTNIETKVSKIFVDPEKKNHTYKFNEENEEWYEERNLRKEGQDSIAKPGAKRYYPIYRDPSTGRISSKIKFSQTILPVDTKGQNRIWRRAYEDVDSLAEKGEIFYKETKYGPQLYFKFRGGLKGETPKSFWDDTLYSASEHGTRILEEIIGRGESFPFPKSPFAVEQCIRVASSKRDAVILDFFAGSGTTGQSVLNLNLQDKGTRQFILCTNNENNICDDVTYPRLQKILDGYTNIHGEDIEGFLNSLIFYKTDFVPSESTDENKETLTRHSVEMLCLRENTFEKVNESEVIKIYKNSLKYTAIIFNEDDIDKLKTEIKHFQKPVSIYIFSFGDEDYSEGFAEFGDNVKLCSIPEAILRIYRRIFK